jgi:glycine/D-amino acid oxidase-like deaminating enzyme
VLEKRDLGLGSTVASTALLQYDTDRPLHQLEKILGEEQADRVFELGVGAVDRVLELAGEYGCEGSRRNSLLICTRAESVEEVRLEFEARTRNGIQCRWIDSVELLAGWGIAAHGAILSPNAGEVDPYRLCHALLRGVMSRGALVHDRTVVTEIRGEPCSWKLATDRGPGVTCRWIVHATGYESASRLPEGLVSLSSTYAFASEPTFPPRGTWLDHALVWEYAEPYLYGRWAGDRLLVGGEDETGLDEAARDALLEDKVCALMKKFRKLVPELKLEPAFAWAGTFASTHDSLGYIGELPGRPGQFFALGFGGNGITFSMVAADVMTALCRGRVHPAAELFAFDRPSAGADEP